MTYATATINPFYAARIQRLTPTSQAQPDQPVYARLPRAPITGSPVPHLTSLYHFDRAGEYGDRNWPGNCGGKLIEDLLTFFRPGLVFDPMTGSGTASDVCQALGIACMAWRYPSGFRRLRPEGFPERRNVRFHMGTPALLADEALRRRCTRPVTQPDARAFPAAIRPVHPQLCRKPETRRQACHPHG